ncbi:MAG: DEAD/DEAH box helicase [Paracoccaceae bacterium]|nr:MAG: DEAD/DEAH box helicase [Paracoccaceae bacterium]
MTTSDFSAFGLSAPLTAGLARAGFEAPTPIQAQAIPPQMAGRDLLGIAQTGTGKTAAFGLPMLQALLAMKGRPAPHSARALVLAPTRELAVQIAETLGVLSGGARLAIQLVLGGMPRGAQIRGIARGVDILIATPGRLTDLIEAGHLRLDETCIFVLDEADRMLDLGFIRPVQAIARRLHPRRRTALFSATMPDAVAGLAAGLLRDPVRVEASPPGQVVQKITQSVELMPAAHKRARLAQIVTDPAVTLALVFARTKRGADRVVQNLSRDGIDAAAIHGNKAQNARQRALKDFSAGRIRVLVATDIAARGIDVRDISHVVQYDLPDEPETYVHRIGRTGRNGAEGRAIAFCAPEEMDRLRGVERVTRQRLAPADAPRPATAARHGAGGPGRSRRRPARRAAA